MTLGGIGSVVRVACGNDSTVVDAGRLDPTVFGVAWPHPVIASAATAIMPTARA